MSVTVRMYSDEELKSIKWGRDKLLATIFMNGITFSEREINCYPYRLRRTFICQWVGEDGVGEPERTVYATDIKTLKEFLNLEYIRLPEFISEKIVRLKDITL